MLIIDPVFFWKWYNPETFAWEGTRKVERSQIKGWGRNSEGGTEALESVRKYYGHQYETSILVSFTDDWWQLMRDKTKNPELEEYSK